MMEWQIGKVTTLATPPLHHPTTSSPLRPSQFAALEDEQACAQRDARVRDGVEERDADVRGHETQADAVGVDFLDAGSAIVSSPIDGIHFDPEAHAILGETVAAKVKTILG